YRFLSSSAESGKLNLLPLHLEKKSTLREAWLFFQFSTSPGEYTMRSFILSAAMFVGALGLFVATDSAAQAGPWARGYNAAIRTYNSAYVNPGYYSSGWYNPGYYTYNPSTYSQGWYPGQYMNYANTASELLTGQPLVGGYNNNSYYN